MSTRSPVVWKCPTPARTPAWSGTRTRRSLTCARIGGLSQPGLPLLPEVKRIVMTNIGGQVGQNMDTVAQRVVNNEYDATLDMRSSVIGNILKANPKVTTHSGIRHALRLSGLVAELIVGQHPA